MTDTARRVLWTFVFAFLGVLCTLGPGFLAAPNLKNGKALIVAAIAAGLAAAGSLIKNKALPSGSKAR